MLLNFAAARYCLTKVFFFKDSQENKTCYDPNSNEICTQFQMCRPVPFKQDGTNSSPLFRTTWIKNDRVFIYDSIFIYVTVKPNTWMHFTVGIFSIVESDRKLNKTTQNLKLPIQNPQPTSSSHTSLL